MDAFITWLEPWFEAWITVVAIWTSFGILIGLVFLALRYEERRDARRRRKQGPLLFGIFKPNRPDDSEGKV